MPATTPPKIPARHCIIPQLSATKSWPRIPVWVEKIAYQSINAERTKPLQNSTPAMIRITG